MFTGIFKINTQLVLNENKLSKPVMS